MTILSSLPQRFEHLIASVEPIAKDDRLTVGFVKNGLPQGGQTINSRIAHSARNDAALLCPRASSRGSRSVPPSTYCNKYRHLDPTYWTRYPYLKPEQKGFIVDLESDTTIGAHDYILLLLQRFFFTPCTAFWNFNLGPRANGLKRESVLQNGNGNSIRSQTGSQFKC